MHFTCDDKGEISVVGWTQNCILILLSVLPECVSRLPHFLSYMLVQGWGGSGGGLGGAEDSWFSVYFSVSASTKSF